MRLIADRGDQFVSRRALAEIQGCPGLLHRMGQVGLLMHRESNHADLRQLGGDPPGGLDAIDVWHRHIHQHDIGMRLLSQLDRFLTIARLAHHFDPLAFAEQVGQPPAENRMIVGQQNPDRVVRLRRRVGRGRFRFSDRWACRPCFTTRGQYRLLSCGEGHLDHHPCPFAGRRMDVQVAAQKRKPFPDAE